MLVRVQYHNNEYNYVSSSVLDRLITDKEISKFYRPSEKRWITLGVDPVRKKNSARHDGPEKRQSREVTKATVRAWLPALSSTV